MIHIPFKTLVRTVPWLFRTLFTQVRLFYTEELSAAGSISNKYTLAQPC
jgi:hypothetical protein